MIQRTTNGHHGDPFSDREPQPMGELSNDEYHLRSDGISNSMLSDFLEDPGLFYGRYVTGTIPLRTPTPDMQFGTWVHQVLLEGAEPRELILGNVVEIPAEVLSDKGERRGKRWIEWAQNQLLENGCPARCLKRSEMEAELETIATLEAIRESVKRCKDAWHILYESMGDNEVSIEWRDEATGLLLRSRLDRLTDGNHTMPALIADVKTTPRIDARSFAAAIYRFGYHRQGHFYREAVRSVHDSVLPFYLIPIRKTQPYSPGCYRLSDSAIEIGGREVRAALDDIARRRDANDWTAPESTGVFEIDLPRYAQYEEEYAL